VLRDELRDAINRVSAENGSNTPDLILANFLEAALEAFDEAVRDRDLWYGVSLGPRNLSNHLKIGSVGLIHASQAHPDFDYAMTEGPRKYWDSANEPPPGEGWERNVYLGEYGWRRLDFVEQAFWIRRKPAAESSADEPQIGYVATDQPVINTRPDPELLPPLQFGPSSYIRKKEKHPPLQDPGTILYMKRKAEDEEEVPAPGKGSDSGEGDSKTDHRD
jgi:hypothetical protein